MRVERTIVLPVRRDEAWEVLVDWERQATWMVDADRVDVTSPHREGEGVTLAVRTRVLGVPAFTEPIQVVVWDPPRLLAVRHGGPVSGTGTWSLDGVEGGTRFRWSEELRLAAPVVGGFVATLYAPVLGLLMDRAMEGLRRYVIAAGPGGTVPGHRP